MSDQLFIQPQPIKSPNVQPLQSKRQGGVVASKNHHGPSFEQVLGDKLSDGLREGVRFSKHAQLRMQSRGLKMDASDLNRLNNAVKLADEKGSRDSLVILDRAALVVSVKDNTVVTVADKEQLKDNVFTKIDSAIFA